MFKFTFIFFVLLSLVLSAVAYHEDSQRIRNFWVNMRGFRKSGEQQNEVNCQTTDNLQGNCLPLASCFHQYGNVKEMRPNCCQMSNGDTGICCPFRGLYRHTEHPPFEFRPPAWPSVDLDLNEGDLERGLGSADGEYRSFIEMEDKFTAAGQVQRPDTLSAIFQNMFAPPNENLQELNAHGLRILEVTKKLGQHLHLGPLEMRDGLSHTSLYGTRYQKYCPRIPKCQKQKYRTFDGSCNNLKHPLWGKSITQFNRILPPSYSDGICEFRNSVRGTPLPLPRVITNELIETSNRADNRINVMFMQWGQFVDHDLTLGSVTRAHDGQGLQCCNQTEPSQAVYHPACRPIILPDNDPFYAKHNRKCNNFVRSAAAPKNDCSLGAREQTNLITSFIDGSMIYGNTYNRSILLRTFTDGLLKTSHIDDSEFLPFDAANNSISCTIPRETRLPPNIERRCVFAGDIRVNQNFGLISLQLFFLREHNRLARALRQLNPNWNDEHLFQEARRIVGAEMQHITFNEWLPAALGRSVLKATGLMLEPTGFCDGYDESVDPSILNEFHSAAFRLHTLVQDGYHMIDRQLRKREFIRMRRLINNPTTLYQSGAINQLTTGLLSSKAQASDNVIVEELTNFFAPSNSSAPKFGFDLISIHIQRGRDHGIPPYNDIRQACGLSTLDDFEDLNGIIRPDMVENFALVYEDVHDIDFWVAGVNEIPMADAVVGPSFSCIIAEQFRRLRYGDRFWYENGHMKHSFTANQLEEIRKVSLAGIICANGYVYQKVQPLAMLTISKLNQEIDCEKIPQMNLVPWRNEQLG